MNRLKELKDLKDLVQKSVDKGVSSVEDVHRQIMNQPLNILQNMMPPNVPIRRIKRIQNRIVGSVYDTIRQVNKTLGDAADDILLQNRAQSPSPGRRR